MKQQSYLPLLVVMYASAFLAGFNENLVNMGLVSIMSEFVITSVTAQWLVTGYMIVATVVVMSMAFLYRRVKLRTLYFFAAAFCLAGSVMGLLAPNFGVLLAARLVQAVGTGIFIPMMMNTILVVTPKNKLGAFMSIGGCMITFGPAFAPVVCGALVTSFGWHSVFVVPIVVMAVLAVAAAFNVRNLDNMPAQLDVPSVALSAVFLFALSFGLVQVMGNLVVGIVSLVVALAAAVVFVLRQFKVEHPLIDLTPMKSAKFFPAVIMVVVAMMIMFSLSVLLPLYFEGGLGMSAFTAGIVILIPVLVNAGFTLLGGRIMDSKGEWPLLPLGFGIAFVGTAAMAAAAPTMSAPAVFAAALLVYGGIGLVFSPSQTAGLRTLPPQQNPFGVALMTTFVQIAACIGPSMFTGILNATQAAALADGRLEGVATSQGFAAAITVAAVIGFAGFAISLAYALAARRRASAQVQAAPECPVAIDERTPVARLMERDAFVMSANLCVRDAMNALVSRGVSSMPLVDEEGRLAGFVSDGDIMRYLADQHPLVTGAYSLLEAVNASSMDERLRELLALPVASIATEQVVAMTPQTTFKDACQLLSSHGVKKAPVVDAGRVVGVVNRPDLLRYAMRTYLASER